MEGFVRKLRQAIIALAPPLTGMILVLATATPLYIGHIGEVMPQLGVIAVFFWVIYRPDLMTYGAAFAIGLVADIVMGAPLGITALVLIVVRRVVLAQRRYFIGKPFRVLWFGFALIALPASLLGWLIASIYLFDGLAILRVLVQAGLTIVMFPPIAWLLTRCQVLLPMPRAPVLGRG
ncbi:MAG: rod shape-determining protein MreD [Alphaproteobacteria bacterium]|jgi:rod shape-determining protein MreD|nr:rod shape-determining protein MreD [Rhodospirillaceae bacterium]MBT6509858.1 rod shape-determining protein MreD [Rhodospirillaceae bacterium]MBT7614373.1 rod shape-determining protein MreD [Rhodospirillaceae bacterium]MBT7648516.1 rod shape-determining protein MreD [Rhodospirillaceae bacterium]MDG2479963.1 rod shape-determining protein MreD [Alphaproteobacteria bacterium]